MVYYDIIDDYVSKNSQFILLNLFESDTIPWYYNSFTTPSKESGQRYQYTNTFIRDGHYCQSNEDINYLKQLLPFPEWETHKCWRIKFNLTNPYKHRKLMKPHVDIDPSISGVVYLYYVNDSDGDTKLYPNINKNYSYKWWKFWDCVRVKPKQGRVVRMSTDLWHSGNNPYFHDRRIVGNFVFI